MAADYPTQEVTALPLKCFGNYHVFSIPYQVVCVCGWSRKEFLFPINFPFYNKPNLTLRFEQGEKSWA